MLGIMSIDHPIIEDTRERIVTPANGVTSLTVPFYFQQNDDIALYRRATSADSWTRLDEGDDYSLAGANVNSGGTATLTAAANGTAQYRVLGLAVIDRLTSVIQGGSQRGLLIDKELDRQRIISQELRRDVDGGGDGLAAERAARIAADLAETTARINGDNALASLIGSSQSPRTADYYETRLAITFATIAPEVAYVVTGGYAAIDDNGGGLYRRLDFVPEWTSNSLVQSFNGVWLELVAARPDPRQFGAVASTLAFTDMHGHAILDPAESTLIDVTTEFQHFIDYCRYYCSGRHDIPAGAWFFAKESASLSLGYGTEEATAADTGSVILAGAGMEQTILVFEPVVEEPDVKSLFKRNTYETPVSGWMKGAEFRDLQILSYWGVPGYTPTDPEDRLQGTPIWLMEIESLTFRQVKWKNITNFAMISEDVHQLIVEGCEFDVVCNDGVHIRNARDVRIVHNRFRHSNDNPIAIGATIYRDQPYERCEKILIAGNYFEDMPGISVSAARNTTITANEFNRCCSGIDINEFTDPSFALNPENHNIQITDNRILNLVPRSYLADDAYRIYMQLDGHNMNGTPPFPGVFDVETGLVEAPYAHQYTNTPAGGGNNAIVRGNILARTLPAVDNWSDWGFGYRFGPEGFFDPPVTDRALRPNVGIAVQYAWRNLSIEGNFIGTAFNGINFAHPTKNGEYVNCRVVGNTLHDITSDDAEIAVKGIAVDYGVTAYAVDLLVTDNVIDLDPYYLSPRRNDWPDGKGSSWADDSDGAHVALYFGASRGVVCERNHIKNAQAAFNDTLGVNRYDANILYCDPIDENTAGGVGKISGGGNNKLYVIDLFDTEGNFGLPRTQAVTESASIPTAGWYRRGDFVICRNAGAGLQGWFRLTTGDGHVLDTDWKAIAAP